MIFNFEFILFLFLSLLMIYGSLMVISAQNPIHSVLYLILVFCSSAAFFIVLGVEFLGIIFMIVYVGAIAILFLFVVMMLNIKLIEFNENILRYLPLSGLIGTIFVIELFLILDKQFIFLTNVSNDYFYFSWINHFFTFTNIELLGLVLYTKYFYLFILAGLILLVAMIGAIVLTLYFQSNLKRQNVFKQTSRHFSRAVILRK